MPHCLKVVPCSAVYCPLVTIFHARSESFRRPYTGKLFILPPQRLLGYSEVPPSIHPFWDWLVKEEMLRGKEEGRERRKKGGEKRGGGMGERRERKREKRRREEEERERGKRREREEKREKMKVEERREQEVE